MGKRCNPYIPYIVVNATALDRSGALSILKQFIENIPESADCWLIFVPENVCLTSCKSNVRLEPIPGVKPMHKRLLWDAFGLNKWLNRHDIEPIACLSLQNTGFHVAKKKIPQFIYYHQSLPFYPYKWNPLKREHRTLWFYKNIYPFFVKLFLQKDTTVFVQLDYIKRGFIKRYNHPPENVGIYSPSVAKINVHGDTELNLSDSINLFYPATGHFYKNHQVLYEAVKKLGNKVRLYVTIPSDEDNVMSTGVVPFEQVCEMYHKCDALVFPSYIETFGLPLLEAAQTGMPILAADLPYAREVLDGYEGVTYVPFNDPNAWKEAIENLEKGKRYEPIDIYNRKGWSELFNTITSKL